MSDSTRTFCSTALRLLLLRSFFVARFFARAVPSSTVFLAASSLLRRRLLAGSDLLHRGSCGLQPSSPCRPSCAGCSLLRGRLLGGRLLHRSASWRRTTFLRSPSSSRCRATSASTTHPGQQGVPVGVTVVERDARLDDTCFADGDVLGPRTIARRRALRAEWKVANTWVPDERREALRADGAFADVGVPVTVSAEFDLRVVEVKAAKSRACQRCVRSLRSGVRYRRCVE